MHWSFRALAVATILSANATIALAQTPSIDNDRHQEIRVLLAWLADPELCRYHPNVRVEGNSLALFGYVPSEALRDKSARLAQAQSALAIKNRIKVCSGFVVHPAKSAAHELLKNAELALKTEFAQQCKHWQLTSPSQGRLALIGLVRDRENKLRISERLRRIPGCICVDNRLHISALLSLKDLPSMEKIIKTERPRFPAKAEIVKSAPTLPAPPPPVAQGLSTTHGDIQRRNNPPLPDRPNTPAIVEAEPKPLQIPAPIMIPHVSSPMSEEQAQPLPSTSSSQANGTGTVPAALNQAATLREQTKPRPTTFISSDARLTAPNTRQRTLSNGLLWKPISQIRRVSNPVRGPILPQPSHAPVAFRSDSPKPHVARNPNPLIAGKPASGAGGPRRFGASQLQSLRNAPPVPAPSSMSPIEKQLFEIVQRAFGGRLAGLHVRLSGGKNVQIRFACRNVQEAHLVAKRIVSLPQLAAYTVKLSASVPKRQTGSGR